jgi:hypothetical protein
MFLFGLGPAEQTEEQLQRRVSDALRKLADAGVRDTALQLPSRLSPENGVRALVDALQGPGRAVVFCPEPQRMIAALGQVARGQARLEQRTVKVASPSPPLGGSQDVPIAPPVESQPAPPADGKKQSPPPPQRYVPAVPRQNVFKKKR